MSRAERFVGMSAELTGFGRVDLLGTGLASSYLSAIDAALPPGVLDELLDAFDDLPATDREAAVGTRILRDPKLGPVARNVVLAWYCGTWTALPDAWRAAYGTSPLDTDRVLSTDAYQAGLQWAVAGAHPAGARQQGYGAWAEPPKGPLKGAPA